MNFGTLTVKLQVWFLRIIMHITYSYSGKNNKKSRSLYYRSSKNNKEAKKLMDLKKNESVQVRLDFSKRLWNSMNLINKVFSSEKWKRSRLKLENSLPSERQRKNL